jgi:Uma2 family endonuclease
MNMKRVVKNNFPKTWNLADLLKHLGDISPNRIRLDPAPGTAVESDVTAIQDHEDRLYELIDGVLVEKVMGFQEAFLAAELVMKLGPFVKKRDFGIVIGDGGTVRLEPGLVRIADVAFFSWERLGGRKVPSTPVPSIYPDLAIEVLSESNTKGEMQRKRKDFFFHGVRLVWEVDPKTRCVDVYTSPEEFVRYNETDTLDGGDVLPGFTLSLQKLFAGCEKDEPETPPARPKKKRRK